MKAEYSGQYIHMIIVKIPTLKDGNGDSGCMLEPIPGEC
jgi:hypothetical protein